MMGRVELVVILVSALFICCTLQLDHSESLFANILLGHCMPYFTRSCRHVIEINQLAKKILNRFWFANCPYKAYH